MSSTSSSPAPSVSPSSSLYTICPACQSRVAQGQRYCPTCGEPLDPELIAQLQALYGALRDLDARIAAGEGEHTVTQLHDEYRTRYLAERDAPSPAPAQVADLQWLYHTLLDLDARIAAGQGNSPLTQLRTDYAARYAAERRGPASRPTGPTGPSGPAFSWRAFVQDQAISIMAYLGGFLLLIATLTFIVGAWQALGDGVKLAIVIAVHLVFLVLGVALRRAPHLKTVSSAYLAVFALMAPLVALATYRFALQGLNLPVAGILCIAAAYGAIIYLALAWRTQFATYGYLGWVALLLALVAGVRWIELPSEWLILTLATYSLVLLAPGLVGRIPSLAVLATSARYVSAVSSGLAAICALSLGLAVWIARMVNSPATIGDWLTVLLATSGVLVLLALGWSLTVRAFPVTAPLQAIALADTSVAGTLAFAAFSIAVWLGATRAEMATLFAGLGLLVLGGITAVRALRSGAHDLRVGLASLASALSALGALMVLVDAAPNGPLLASLGVGILTGIVMAVMERAPWWELAAGVFLLAETPAALAAVRATGTVSQVSTLVPVLNLPSFPFAALAVLLWVLALLLAGRAGLRAYALPAYIVALGAAAIATITLPLGASVGDVQIMPGADYQTAVLGIFALASLAVGVRERALALASVPVALFGLLLPLPYAAQHSSEGVPLSLVALAASLVALGLRRLFGRAWAYAPYGVALWVTLFAALHAAAPGVDTTSWSALGITFAAGLLLLVALLASLAAWWEGHPAAMAAAALLALVALLLTPSAIAQAALVVVLVAVGVILRQTRGRYWNVAWLAVALPASLVASVDLRAAPEAGPWYQVGALLVFALLAYAAAAQERTPWLTLFAVAYSLLALLVMPGPDNLLPTVALTGAAVLGGIVTRVLVSRISTGMPAGDGRRPASPIAWTAAWYAVAGAGSIETVLRSGVTSELLPIALLVLALLAYLVAAVERTPWITPLAAVYGLWAALVIPGPDRLLPTVALAIGAALAGGVVRLVAGRPWALALYAVGIGASLLSLVRVVPFDSNTLQVVLLAYTVVACIVVAIEREPLAGIAPALYGSGAVLIQSDARLLLPVALGFGLVGMVLSRRLDARWALPWYIVTAVAGIATAIRGIAMPDFEPLALVALALLAYAIAAAEALPEVLPISFITGVLALASALSVFQLANWQGTLAFLGLSYIYMAAQWFWRALPGLDPRQTAPQAATPARPAGAVSPAATVRAPQPPRNSRALGVTVHRVASLVLGGGTLLVALLTPDAFTPQTVETQVAAAALLAMAGLVALGSRLANTRGPLYVGGVLVALALSWEARWLGADNVQAYVLAPGAYLLLIGALLPRDRQVGNSVALGQWASVLGTLVLLLPTFAQTFSPDQELLYMGALTVEALLIVGVGLGTRARTLVLLGAAFVGIAALRGAVLALGEGVPVFLLIAVVAVVLLVAATWLSLRPRQNAADQSQSPVRGSAVPGQPAETAAVTARPADER